MSAIERRGETLDAMQAANSGADATDGSLDGQQDPESSTITIPDFFYIDIPSDVRKQIEEKRAKGQKAVQNARNAIESKGPNIPPRSWTLEPLKREDEL